MRSFYKPILTLMFAALLCAVAVPVSNASLMIMPVRVEFKDGERMKTLTVINNGREQAVFRIGFVNKRQIESGNYTNIEGPLDPKYDLSKMIVFSPRQINLPPQGKQAVRLVLRRPADLPDGEYRTHVSLDRISNIRPGAAGGKGVSGKIGVNVGFEVPLTVRKGKYDTSIRITSAKLLPASLDASGKKKPSQVQVQLERKGKYSAMGKLNVYWTPPGGGEQLVGTLNAVNIFHELTKRTANVKLNTEGISGGTFRIVFQGADADKGIKFDEKNFPVQ